MLACVRGARAAALVPAALLALLWWGTAPTVSSAQWLDNALEAAFGPEEEESSITVNGMVKGQGGLFVPLASSGFQPHHNRAVSRTNPNFDDGPCDPVATPLKPCYPTDHGQKPASPSIARATLQLEAHWDITTKLAIHAIIRGVRSASLPADEYAQVPVNLDPVAGEDIGKARREYAREWAADHYYNEFEMRELYLDFFATDWLSFRIGRQQVAWGETGSFRLLDVVNPIDNTWHFGPLEAFEDQRIPLWMLLTTVEVPALEGALEMLYIPGLDRAEDMVGPPLSNVGAWGVPYGNQAPTYRIQYKDFQYPGGSVRPEYMRGGARWKGDLGERTSYSLVYMYTHMTMPVLEYATQIQTGANPDGTPIFDPEVVSRGVFSYPRQHITGLSLEYAFDSPIALTARFEGAVEPNRSFSRRTDTAGDTVSRQGYALFEPTTRLVVNYAFVLQRPTMIRWLNPTQNFLLVAQFRDTVVPGVDDIKDNDFVQVVGYNDWRIQRHSYTLVFFATTNYLRGIITPKITAVYMPNPYYRDSGFVSVDLGFRIGPHWRLNLTATDFVGKHPYRDLGLFRDRDELHGALTLLF